MSKRFTATEKWDDPWYRKLPPKYKCLWQLIIDKCDNSGVWTKDFEIIKHFIGDEVYEEEALKVFNSERKRIKILNNGKYWLVLLL